MQEMNMPVVVMTSFIPIILGFIWYHPKIFGATWMKEAGISEASIKGSNMAIILGGTFFFSIILSLALQTMVIHQFHLGSIIMGEPDAMNPNSAAQLWLKESMAAYGQTFKTFKHGALHGSISGLFIALPILGINSLFERRSRKYILLHSGYWILTLALMGGVLCQFSK
jgi:hypothetical protein